MHESERLLRQRMADELCRRAREVTAGWVDAVSGRLDIERRDVLPTAQLLDDVPECLEAIAEFIADPDTDFPDELLRDRMDALVRFRRRQGFGVAELLDEYDLLAARLQEFIEDAVDDADVDVEPRPLAAVVGDLKEGFARFGLETARSYRLWAARERRRRFLETTTFAAMLRHELRNRLGSAQTAAELLREPGLSPERRKRLAELIAQGLEQALETVDVVREVIARDEADTSTITRTWVPLEDVIEYVAGDGHQSRDPRVEVRIGLDCRMEVPDPKVGMVLLNLVDNAIKYHDPKRDDRWVRIVAEPSESPTDMPKTGSNDRPAAGGNAQRLRITVEDNGPGIDRELHETIFDFTVRGRSASAGSGLGLALSRDIVRQMGGEMRLESEPGAGTRVSVVVPARRVGGDSSDGKMDRRGETG